MNTRLIAFPAALLITLASLPLFHLSSPLPNAQANPAEVHHEAPPASPASQVSVVTLPTIVVHPSATDRATAELR